MNMENLQTIITVASVVFASGFIYGKIGNLEKKIDRLEKTSEKVTRLEVEVNNLKEKIA